MTLAAAVVFCIYTDRRWGNIVRAVDSVRRDDTAAEVVIVVDHDDHLLRRAGEWWPDLLVVSNRHSPGPAGARNTGIEHTSAPLIAFMDADSAARPGWLAELIDPFADERVAVVGGRAEPHWAHERAPAMLCPELFWVVGSSYAGQPTQRAQVRNVMGCSMAFRRKALNGLGGFDTHLGQVGMLSLGCEVTELCIRIRRQDPRWRVVLNPASVIDHAVSPAQETWWFLLRRSYLEGVSKASVARIAGHAIALETERAYLLKVLPKAVWRELRDGRWQASLAMGVAVLAAGVGYTVGLRRMCRKSVPPPSLALVTSAPIAPSASCKPSTVG